MSVFIWPVRVYYEDTDSGGLVYYANYLKFMERARTESLRNIGIEQESLRQTQGIIFAVRSIMVDYLRPAHLDDYLWVSAQLSELGKASLTFEHLIVRGSAHATPTILNQETLSKGLVKIACLDAKTLRPRALPDFISLGSNIA